MKRLALRSALLVVASATACAAGAQAVKAYEHSTVGVRMSIPANWKWDDRPREAFVNCAPEREERGRPACYFIVRGVAAAPDQRAITDADRKKWLDLATDQGRSTILSSRDEQVAGLPAFHIVVRSGRNVDDWIGSVVYVLAPAKGRVFRITYNAILAPADYERYKPAVMKALQTLAPAP